VKVSVGPAGRDFNEKIVSSGYFMTSWNFGIQDKKKRLYYIVFLPQSVVKEIHPLHIHLAS
jgi:hypothetical protein